MYYDKKQHSMMSKISPSIPKIYRSLYIYFVVICIIYIYFNILLPYNDNDSFKH